MIFTRISRQILLFISALTCLVSTNVVAQMYDRFNGSIVSASRWQPPAITGSAIAQELSVSRGYLHMYARGAGRDTKTTGNTTRTRVLMRLPVSRVVKPDGSNRLTALQSFVVVRKFEVKGCSLRGAAESQSRFVQINSWFNDGRSTGPGDQLGDVYAGLMLAQDSGRAPGTKASELQVRFSLSVCEDSVCSTGRSLIDGNSSIKPILTKVKVGERISLRSSFAEIAQRITFTVKAVGKRAFRRKVDLAPLTTLGGNMSTPRFAHSLQLRAETADCDLRGGARRPVADMRADVDYVRATFKKN